MLFINKLKIGTRIVLNFLVVVVITISVIATLTYLEAKKSLTNQIESDLAVISKVKKQELTQYIQAVENRAKDFSTDGVINNSLINIINNKKDSTFVTSLNNHLRLNKIVIDENIYGINILNNEGRVVASTSDSEINLDLSNQEYYNNIKSLNDKSTFISNVNTYKNFSNTARSFITGSSIIDSKTKQRLGYILNYSQLSLLNSINKDTISDTTNNSNAQKYNLFLTNSSGEVIVSSDPIYNQFFTNTLTTLPITNCKQGLSTNGMYKDYKNIQVIGSADCLSNGWISIIEIDESKAFLSIDVIKENIYISAFIILIITLLLALYLTKRITNPIKKLTRMTTKVSEGNLEQDFTVTSNDEIGELGNNFNIMKRKLNEYNKELENKIELRTKEISSKAHEIDQKNAVLEDRKNALLNVFEDLEQEKYKIETILYSIGDAVFVIDINFKITVINDICLQMIGYTKNEVINKRYDEVLKFIDENTGETNNEFLTESIKKGIITGISNHTVLINRKGERIPISDSAAPLKNRTGKVMGCVVVFRDVTKERDVDRAKTEFVSLASHQLRTPLTAINWYCEMLLDGDAGDINKDQKEYLNEIYIGNKRMVELVNALLNVSRIDLGTFAIEPQLINFIEISDSVIKELTPQITLRSMNIEKEYGDNIPLINADLKLIRIIFQNLLSNAIKYTPDNGQILINIFIDVSNINIFVKDTGYGIPKDQQDKIFSKLFRADNVKAKDTEGTGLGLYIIKSIMEEAGGKVWFESEENVGTTFYVTLPLSGMIKKDGGKELS